MSCSVRVSTKFTASSAPPATVSDPNPSNNSAVFVTNIGPVAALTVDKGTSTGTGTVTSAPTAIVCGPACTSQSAKFLVGSMVTLQKGEQAYITQSLGGTYTVVVNGNMFRIEGKDGKPSKYCGYGEGPTALGAINTCLIEHPTEAEFDNFKDKPRKPNVKLADRTYDIDLDEPDIEDLL